MSHYLIFGSGMLAKELAYELERRGDTYDMWSRATGVDITDRDRLVAAASRDGTRNPYWRWNAVFNAAAYTNVDGAEDDVRMAFAVNALGAENVARLSTAPLVHFSTDAVFDDGDSRNVARRTETRPPGSPRSVYARSKLLGEQLVRQAHPSPYIVRIGNTYGTFGLNWASRLRERLLTKEPVVADWNRLVNPTWVQWVAEVSVRLLDEPPGLYHASASGVTTWWDFALEMILKMGREKNDTGLTGDSVELKAPRSRRGDLVCDMLPLRGIDVPRWDALLSKYLAACSTSPTSERSAVPAEPVP